MDETDSGSWTSWIQTVAGNVLNKAAEAEYVYPYETEKLRLQQLGQLGYYTEGQRMIAQQQGLNIAPEWLLLGGLALVAVMMLGD